jgi:hypothetical protein
MYCVAAMAGAMGIAAGMAVAAENNSSLAPLINIYLNPPGPVPLDPSQNLLSAAIPADTATPGATLQAEAQGLFDYTQTLIEGEELMFIMDVPAIPPQQTPIVLAQAAAPDTTTQFDFILKDCQETHSTGDSRSAMRAVDPAYMLKNYLQNRDRQYVELNAIKTTLLEGTKHGEITTEVDNTGLTFYGYDPEPEYVGNDRAVFMAEFEGKRYKIVIDLKVFLEVIENLPSACPEPRLIKVTKPSSGANGYRIKGARLK